MKMSKRNYERLTRFYRYTVETAGDKEVELILEVIAKLAEEIIALKGGRKDA